MKSKALPVLKGRTATIQESQGIEMCPMNGCWQPSRSQKEGGLCNACGSWWQRIQLLQTADLALYMKKQHRMAGRIEVFSQETKSKRKVG